MNDPAASGPSHWFEPVADHLGDAYLRYSFTKGTENETEFLIDALSLAPESRILDVGCGPGRHSHAFGARGYEVVGVDVSQTFVEIAGRRTTPGVTFVRADARHLEFDSEFDAVISLCQGAFGLSGGPAAQQSLEPDLQVLERMAAALRPGGRLGMSAFSAYFQLRYLESGDSFDAAAGVNHERTVVKDAGGVEKEVDLWTTCFTPRELRLMCSAAGLEVEQLWSVTPGRYAANPPNVDEPELLVVAVRR